MKLRKTSVIFSVLDCCREFVFEASEPAQTTPPATRGGSELGEHFTLFACGPSGDAFDGTGKHGSGSIFSGETLTTYSLGSCWFVALCPPHFVFVSMVTADKFVTHANITNPNSNHDRKAHGHCTQASAKVTFRNG